MRLPAYLKRSRHGVYYFRFVIPLALRFAFDGRIEVRRSLATRDPKVAKSWAYALGPVARAILEEARVLAGKFPKGVDLDKLLSDPANRNLEVELRDGTKLRADSAIPGEVDALKSVLDHLGKSRQIPVREALDDSEAERLAQVQARFPPLHGKAFGTGDPAPAKFKPIRLTVAIKFYDHNVLKKEPNTKTAKKYRAILDELAQHSGDIWVHELDESHIVAFRNAQNAMQRAASTIDNKVSAISGFLKWCLQELHFPKGVLPTAGQIQLSKAKRIARANGYERFTLDELIRIFLSPTPARRRGRGSSRSAAERGAPALAYLDENLGQPHWFWLPILALYTGARIEELCQLHLNDIYRKDGVLVMDINSLDDKGVKTAAGVRHIPIHPAVEALGFVDYVDDVKEAIPGAARLFPYLVPAADDILSGSASKKFAGYLERCGVKNERRSKSFHSFRGTANQELTDRGVSLEYRCLLVGHDINSVNVKSYQVDGVSIALLHNAGIALMRYEREEANRTVTKLDLSPLRYSKGQFIDLLRHLAAVKPREAQVRRERMARAKARGADFRKKSAKRSRAGFE
jgi:integrase